MLYWFQLNPLSSSKSKISIKHGYIRLIKGSVFQAIGIYHRGKSWWDKGSASRASRVQVLLDGFFLLNLFYSNTIQASMPEWSTLGKPRLIDLPAGPIICTLVHNAISFIDTSDNVWYIQVHWIIGTPYLSIIANDASVKIWCWILLF